MPATSSDDVKPDKQKTERARQVTIQQKQKLMMSCYPQTEASTTNWASKRKYRASLSTLTKREQQKRVIDSLCKLKIQSCFPRQPLPMRQWIPVPRRFEETSIVICALSNSLKTLGYVWNIKPQSNRGQQHLQYCLKPSNTMRDIWDRRDKPPFRFQNSTHFVEDVSDVWNVLKNT